jgi:hypothetical protein
VQASRSDAIEDRPGRWDVRAKVMIDWVGAFLHKEPGTSVKRFGKFVEVDSRT